jgi:molecular chaperone HscB
MRSVPVVAVLVSPHKCVHCATRLEDFISQHVCPQCGMPQPVLATDDYFEAFGVDRRFAQDRAFLEKRFYELSRALHPDKFSNASAEAKNNSLERMSFVNQAYGTLKHPGQLRDYLLKIEGTPLSSTKLTMPMELAEAWFEIQDLLTEDAAGAVKRLADFEGELGRLQAEVERELNSLENKYDQTLAAPVLAELSHKIQRQSYLKSMDRDVERIKKNAHSN